MKRLVERDIVEKFKTLSRRLVGDDDCDDLKIVVPLSVPLCEPTLAVLHHNLPRTAVCELAPCAPSSLVRKGGDDRQRTLEA
jgi:hypothetical protein